MKPANDVAGGANGELELSDVYSNSVVVVREVKTADVADVSSCGACVGAAPRPKEQPTAHSIDDHGTWDAHGFSANPGIKPASPLMPGCTKFELARSSFAIFEHNFEEIYHLEVVSHCHWLMPNDS